MLTFEKFIEAQNRMLSQGMREPYWVISPKAWDLAMEILKRDPKAKLYGEWHILAVARSMGII